MTPTDMIGDRELCMLQTKMLVQDTQRLCCWACNVLSLLQLDFQSKQSKYVKLLMTQCKDSFNDNDARLSTICGLLAMFGGGLGGGGGGLGGGPAHKLMLIMTMHWSALLVGQQGLSCTQQPISAHSDSVQAALVISQHIMLRMHHPVAKTLKACR